MANPEIVIERSRRRLLLMGGHDRRIEIEKLDHFLVRHFHGRTVVDHLQQKERDDDDEEGN
jgi:hypothetical protein